ncbi:ML domain-containing protein [Streptomyces sp. NPDC020766]|uniref:ML domain-containing protein n=1 Tax=Streptomyces sp. NPDC020766 TaxID=3155011 RepID=UPI0033E1C25B
MKKIIVIAASLLAMGFQTTHAQAETVEWTDCGSQARVNKVEVSGNSDRPLRLSPDKSYTIGVEFIPTATRDDMEIYLTAETMLHSLDLPVPTHQVGPVKAGSPFTATVDFQVLLPEGTGFRLKAEITDEEDDMVVCALMDAKITA